LGNNPDFRGDYNTGMMNDDNLANSPSERTNQLIRLTMIPMMKMLVRRQKVFLAWMTCLIGVSMISLAVAIATLVEVIR
jgi:hypothetical protein